MKDITVVMVSYHTGVSLWLAVDSVLAQPECTQLVIVNNGNPAGVEALLAQRARKEKKIQLITGHGNVGFAKACNLGAKAAKGDYILLLNPDCMLPEGALALALESMKTLPRDAVAGCYLANPDGSEQRGGRRGLLNPVNAVAESFGFGFVLPKALRLNQNTAPLAEGPQEVPAISGAFMLLTRDYYLKMGGMDERYFLHMEDMDFCYRVNKSGGKIFCLPNVRVVHFRSTSEVSSHYVERLKARSFALYMQLHFAQGTGLGFFIRFLIFGIYMRYYAKRIFGFFKRFFVSDYFATRLIAQTVLLYRRALFSSQDSTLSGKTVLVTGATGQVGLCAVGDLLARGANVLAVTHDTQIPFTHERLNWVERDISKDENALYGAKVDAVIHATNLAYLPKYVTSLAENGAKHIIAMSCLDVLERERSSSADDREEAIAQPRYTDEIVQKAKAAGCEVTMLQTSAIYGAGLDKGITKQATIIRKYGLFPIMEPASGKRQPVHISDVAGAIQSVLFNEKAYSKRYTLGGATVLTYREMLEKIFAYTGRQPWFVKVPFMARLLTIIGFSYALKGVSGDLVRRMNRDVLAPSDDAQQDFGYTPHAFLEGEAGF